MFTHQGRRRPGVRCPPPPPSREGCCPVWPQITGLLQNCFTVTSCALEVAGVAELWALCSHKWDWSCHPITHLGKATLASLTQFPPLQGDSMCCSHAWHATCPELYGEAGWDCFPCPVSQPKEELLHWETGSQQQTLL